MHQNLYNILQPKDKPTSCITVYSWSSLNNKWKVQQSRELYGEVHNNGCKDGHGTNKLINKQVKDLVNTLRHIMYMVLGPCFYRPISTSWVMCSVSCWSSLLSTTPLGTHFSRVDQGAQVNF